MLKLLNNIIVRKRLKYLFMENFDTPLNKDVIHINSERTYKKLFELIQEQYKEPPYLGFDNKLMLQRIDDELSKVKASENRSGLLPDFINLIAIMIAFLAILMPLITANTESAYNIHLSTIELAKDIAPDQQTFIMNSLNGLNESMQNIPKITDTLQTSSYIFLLGLGLIFITLIYLDERKNLCDSVSRRFYNLCKIALEEKGQS